MATLVNYSGGGFVDIATSADPSTSVFNANRAQVSGALITCMFNTWKTVVLTISCPDPTWYATVINPLRLANTPVYFRMGMQNGTNTIYTAWEKHILIASHQEPNSPLSGTPNMVFITTGDMLCFLDVGDQVLVRKGAISDMVTSIANASSIPVVVEPTNGQLTLYQTYQTDFEFIRGRLLRRALNAQGYGDYKFYITNDTLRFATVDYQAGTPISIPYTDTGGPIVYDLKFNDNVWSRMMAGSSGAAITVGNPYQSGKVAITTNDNSSTLAFGNTSINPQPATQFQKLMGRHKGDNPITEIEAQAQNHFTSLRNTQYDASFGVSGNPFLSLSTLINLTFNQTLDYAGLYAINSSIHMLESGSFKSVYTAIRDSSQSVSTGTSLVVGSSQASQPFGSTPSSVTGTPPRINQTSVLSTTASGPTVTLPIQSPD